MCEQPHQNSTVLVLAALESVESFCVFDYQNARRFHRYLLVAPDDN